MVRNVNWGGTKLKRLATILLSMAIALTFMPGSGLFVAEKSHAAITNEGTVGRHLKFDDGVCTALDGEQIPYQYNDYETYVDKEGNLLNMEIKPVHWELDDTGTMTIGDGSDGQVIVDGSWPNNGGWPTVYTFDLDSIKKIQFNGNVNVSNSCDLFNSLNGLQEFDASGLRLGDPIAYNEYEEKAVYGLNVEHLFYNCPELKNLDLRGTGFCENMHSPNAPEGTKTFYGCTKLESLQFDFNDEIAKKNSETFIAGKISVSGAFQNCPNLKSADATYLIGYIAKKYKEGDAGFRERFDLYGDWDGGLAYAAPTVINNYSGSIQFTISENVVYGLYDEYPEFYRTRMEDKVNALKDAIESIGTSTGPYEASRSTAEAFTAYENAVENFITMETYNEVRAMKDEAAALLAQDPFPHSDAVKEELQNIVSMTDALGGLSTKQDAQNIINRYNNYNQMVAGAVKDLFDALPAKDDVKLSHEEHISAVRSTYRELTDNQKALISTDELQKLVDAETGLSELKTLVSDLQDLVDETKALNTDIYSEASVAALTQAIADAEALFPPTGDPTKGQVDAARIALEDARRNLKTKEAQNLEDAKAELGILIGNAEAMNSDLLTDESKADLEDAINAAKDVYNKDDATKEEVDKAIEDFENAIKGLNGLDDYREAAENELRNYKNHDDYSETGKAELNDIINTAIAEINTKTSEAEIDAIVEKAKADMDAVKTKAQEEYEKAKKDLNDSIDDAEDKLKDKDKYTEDTAEALEKARDAAKDIAGNPDATKDDLDKAKQDLDDAIAGLKEKDAGGNDPGTGGNDPGTSGGNDPGNGGNDPNAPGTDIYNNMTYVEVIKYIPVEVTPETPASLPAVEAAILKAPNDNDIKGSTYAPLKFLSKKQTKKSIKLQWSKVKGAKQYTVYGNLCGKGKKYKKIKTVKGKSLNLKKVAGKKIKKGKYYKFIIVAENGDKAVALSKTIHVASAGKKKVANNTKVTVSKKVIKKAKKLKAKKTLALKAKAEKKKGTKVAKHVKVRYESSNKKVATVSKAGKVKAKKKGSCYIYAYAQNGIAKKIKVTVKK